LKIIEKRITDLLDYENNPRNNNGAIKAVAESIENFGFKVPIIIDQNGVIIAGHTRKKAAELLGLKKVPCIVADDLTPEKVKAFRLAENKTSELAEWDYKALERELEELTAFDVDMSLYGFDERVFNEIMEDVEKDIQKYNSVPVTYEPTPPQPAENGAERIFTEEAEETTAEVKETQYDHIKDLIDEGFIKNELKGYKEEFDITFVFPSSKKELINEFIKSKGKAYIVNKIIELAERGEAA
jgi:hypothetical protein